MRKNKLLLLGLTFVVVAFLTWFVVSIVTMDTELKLVVDYSLPSGNNLNGTSQVDYGNYAVAIDGLVVDKKNDDVQPTASTAKMISALAVMREKPFNLGESGETITITNDFYDLYAWYYNNNGSNTRVEVGEEISEYDALASALLASSNNMADTLAIWAFGSLENYQKYATDMLHEMGITNTEIGPDASGYNAGTTSTAEDLAKIGYYVLKEPVLAEIVGTKYHDVPVAGTITNTNGLLGENRINGIKTGYIGDASGYCLISGYDEGGHIITVALLGAPTRRTSFDDSLDIIKKLQSAIKSEQILGQDQTVAHYESWWSEDMPIQTDSPISILNWDTEQKSFDVLMDGEKGSLAIRVGNSDYGTNVTAKNYQGAPTLLDRIKHVFGWKYEKSQSAASDVKEEAKDEEEVKEKTAEEILAEENAKLHAITNATSDNPTIGFGYLMLINPNFTVDTDFIAARREELVSISELYGIVEGNPYNGDNLLDPEAATHINDMVRAYEAEYPGHTLETRSCFRARGTTCGRLCAATGTSDHHTGLTCDLLDPVYGTSLDTDTYDQHIDWQWLRANSYKYGFIDRFPYEWAGGPMSHPANVDENGSTGLFETWHYRFVGIDAATDIATGKYNGGEYDSLEHYLKARGLITDLKNGH